MWKSFYSYDSCFIICDFDIKCGYSNSMYKTERSQKENELFS